MLWVAYALAQIVPGFASRNRQALRWQGLILMGVAIVKVFLFDLSFLSSFYRIVSFFALGLVLLGVSFFYQKMSARRDRKREHAHEQSLAGRRWIAVAVFLALAAAMAAAPLPGAWSHWRYSRPIDVAPTDSLRLAGLVLPQDVYLHAQTALFRTLASSTTPATKWPIARYTREGRQVRASADGDAGE